MSDREIARVKMASLFLREPELVENFAFRVKEAFMSLEESSISDTGPKPEGEPLRDELIRVMANARRQWSRDDYGTETQEAFVADAVIEFLHPIEPRLALRRFLDAFDAWGDHLPGTEIQDRNLLRSWVGADPECRKCGRPFKAHPRPGRWDHLYCQTCGPEVQRQWTDPS